MARLYKRKNIYTYMPAYVDIYLFYVADAIVASSRLATNTLAHTHTDAHKHIEQLVLAVVGWTSFRLKLVESGPRM